MVQVYVKDGLSRELRQGEIVSGLIQFTFDPVEGVVSRTTHSFSVILNQDCDLLRDFEAAEAKKNRQLNGVLIFEAEASANAKKGLAGGDIFRRVQSHREDRYHLLPPVPADYDLQNEGLPELMVDFRRFFTMPADEVLRQCRQADGAKRRSRLNMPFREHLQNRLGSYFQRVALPND